jgi:arsenate reductase (thioredoxin)
MAEGWARHLGGEWLTAQSAGLESHGKNPRAIKVMREAGVDISRHESTRLTDEMLASTDYMVTVCGHADENCPALPAGISQEHWPLNDPAEATGSEDEIMAAFRESRDDIRRRVVELIGRLKNE